MLRTLRQELRLQREHFQELLRQQGSALRHEVASLRSSQQSGAQQAAECSLEASKSLEAERASRCKDTQQIRSMLESMQDQLRRLQLPAITGSPALVQGSIHDAFKLSEKASLASLQLLRSQLEAEHESRADRLRELHLRIGREVGDALRQLEEQRHALHEALENERSERNKDSLEIRGILDSLWHHVDVSRSSTGFRQDIIPSLGPYKAQEGLAEDIATVYAMAQEALGETVPMRRDLSRCQMNHEKLSKQVHTLEAILRDASGRGASVETLASLAPSLPEMAKKIEELQRQLSSSLEAFRLEMMLHIDSRMASAQSQGILATLQGLSSQGVGGGVTREATTWIRPH